MSRRVARDIWSAVEVSDEKSKSSTLHARWPGEPARPAALGLTSQSRGNWHTGLPAQPGSIAKTHPESARPADQQMPRAEKLTAASV